MSDGNEIYWEASGDSQGKPALFLHGGPGGGIGKGYRRNFDPEKFLIISFEQRGCGRSRPVATAPEAPALSTNTTQAIILDIEELRQHLGVDQWLVTGISWGTTLALAYAEAHPERVSEMILMAVGTTTHAEVEWVTEDMRKVFPEEWDIFAHAVPSKPGQRLIDVYYTRMNDPDEKVRENTANAWCDWEDVHVSLDPSYRPTFKAREQNFRILFATLVTHYWKHGAFLDNFGILENLPRISHLPCVLIHGRLDISSPLQTAWNLHRNWPGSKFVVVETEGHVGPKMMEAFCSSIEEFSK